MPIRFRWRRMALWLAALLGLGSAALGLAYWRISAVASDVLMEKLTDVPPTEFGLLLGTAAYTPEGGRNLYFRYRIQAAAALYKAGKVKRIVVSGDNRHKSYNEPREMYRALVQHGVPGKAILMDFAGFRTLDSVVRARSVFGAQKMVIISQRYHLQRALYIARCQGIPALGYAANEPQSKGVRLLQRLREVLARVLTLLDCHVLDTQPHFAS